MTVASTSLRAGIYGSAMPRRIRILLIQLAVVLLLLGGWQLTVTTGLVEARSISSPVLAGTRLWSLVASGEIWPHLADTIGATILALAISAVLGTAIGLLLAHNRLLELTLDPLLVAIYGIPRVAFGPLVVLFLGVGVTAKVVLAVSIVVFVFCANVQEGMRHVDVTLVRNVSLMGASLPRLFTMVIWPSLVPWLWAALEMGLGLALIGVIIAEFISSTRGLGHLISAASMGFDTTGVAALLILTTAMAMMLRLVLSTFKAVLLPWAEAREH